MPIQELSAEEIVRLCREYTLFDWSVQSRVNPIPVDQSGGSGVKRNDMDESYPRSHPARPAFRESSAALAGRNFTLKQAFLAN